MEPVLSRLGAADAAAYRELRLAGLSRHDCEFAAAFEEEAALPLDAFARRLEQGWVFGAWLEGGLAGVAGFRRPEALKKRHKGQLWGVYVAATARGRGLGEALVRSVIDHARGEVEQLQATVACLNLPARRLYQKLGFEAFGIERRAHKVGERYFDQEHLALFLDEPAAV
jgi:RimJ/RimL family protein N-acetyltransferase